MKIQVTSEWESSPKLASGSLLRRVVSQPRVVSPLLLQLSQLSLLHGVNPLARHTLPVPSGLSLLVHRLLHSTNTDVELAHLLSESGPTR